VGFFLAYSGSRRLFPFNKMCYFLMSSFTVMSFTHLRNCSVRRTITLVCECWLEAETLAFSHVRCQNPGAGEEFITELFWGYLNKMLTEATKNSSLKHAFEEDFLEAFPALRPVSFYLDRVTNNIFMDCQLHQKAVEKKWGGDFGLTLVRPSIATSIYSNHITMKRQGLLCQAKLKSKQGQWRQLTNRQTKTLSGNLPFTALVLYEYTDQRRETLNPFFWQDCSRSTVAQMTDWLRSGCFPEKRTSEDIIWALACGQLGTPDKETIDKRIAVKQRPEVTIRIDWPDNHRPPPMGDLIHAAVPVRQQVYVRSF